MRPLPGTLWCCALAVLVLANGTGHAAWDNVFQVTCHCGQNRTTTNYYPPVVAAPVVAAYPQQPCQQCTTRYEQRSYYQPVTVMQPYTYTEQVTTLRTSYYWDPVTTYQQSCYYDPCSCGYKRVAVPTVSYSLRAQTCPVTSYLERTALKPVTTQQLVTYYQPITSCCQTTMGAPVANLPAGAVAVPAASDNGQQSGPSAGDRTLPNEGGTSRKTTDRLEPVPQKMPYAPGDSSSFRPPELKAPITPTSPYPKAAPGARIDRIAMVPEHEVDGQVLTAASQPRGGARVLLVSKEQPEQKQGVTADEKGQFHVRLTAGSYLVYVLDAEGTPVYYDVLEVQGEQRNPFVLTSR